MIWSKLFTYAASAILLIEVVSLHPSVTISSYTYGITALRSEFSLPFRVQRTLPAALAVAKTSRPNDSIVFTGDVLLARNVEHLMRQNGVAYPFQGVDFSSFAVDPYVIGNFESAVPEVHQQTKSGQIRFSVDSTHIPAVQLAGFTHFSLANNHTLDYGLAGYKNAWHTLSEAGTSPFGDPRGLSSQSIAVIETETKTVAIIALQLLQNLPSEHDIQAVMQYADSVSDMQILYVHWGDEYVLTNNQTQQIFAERFIRYGVDLIVGHHPHVVQNIERINDVLVFYSLGNYIFDQYDTTDTQQGLILVLNVADEASVDLLPVDSLGNLSQPRLMSTGDHADFLAALAARSDERLRTAIKAGNIPLYSSVATSTKMAMINK